MTNKLTAYQALYLRVILRTATRMLQDGMNIRTVRDQYLHENLFAMSELDEYRYVYDVLAVVRTQQNMLSALLELEGDFCFGPIDAHHKYMAHVRYCREQRARCCYAKAWDLAHQEAEKRRNEACQAPGAPFPPSVPMMPCKVQLPGLPTLEGALEEVPRANIRTGEAFFVQDVKGIFHGPYVCDSHAVTTMGVYMYSPAIPMDERSVPQKPLPRQLQIVRGDKYFLITVTRKA